MASVTYNLRIDEIDRAVYAELFGVAERDVRNRTAKVKREVKRLIRERAVEPGRSGDRLEASVRSSVAPDFDNEWIGIVYSDADHAMWFEEGTGIHGPFRVYIFPKGANKLMYFVPTGQTQTVRAHRVQGQRPHHVFRDAIEVARRGTNF